MYSVILGLVDIGFFEALLFIFALSLNSLWLVATSIYPQSPRERYAYLDFHFFQGNLYLQASLLPRLEIS